ncbi:MAG: MerR family transcriptional regulator [Chloroflexi bacterium]|nr:MerR family transcriptional regulator [Chloroflexota bacterium]
MLVGEAAMYLGMTKEGVRALERRGHLTATRSVGGWRLYPLEQVERVKMLRDRRGNARQAIPDEVHRRPSRRTLERGEQRVRPPPTTARHKKATSERVLEMAVHRLAPRAPTEYSTPRSPAHLGLPDVGRRSEFAGLGTPWILPEGSGQARVDLRGCRSDARHGGNLRNPRANRLGRGLRSLSGHGRHYGETAGLVKSKPVEISKGASTGTRPLPSLSHLIAVRAHLAGSVVVDVAMVQLGPGRGRTPADRPASPECPCVLIAFAIPSTPSASGSSRPTR